MITEKTIYSDGDVYELINRAIMWDRQNNNEKESFPDWWEKNKKSQASTPITPSILKELKAANPFTGGEEVQMKFGYEQAVKTAGELLSKGEDKTGDDELEDNIMNIIQESVEQDSDYTLRGTDKAAKKIVRILKKTSSQPAQPQEGNVQVLIDALVKARHKFNLCQPLFDISLQQAQKDIDNALKTFYSENQKKEDI